MKKIILLAVLACSSFYADAMSDAAQAVVVTSAAGLVNAGTAIYMQGQGMNPQFLMLPNGMTTVVPGTAASQPDSSSANNYETQNQQADKQAFFEGN